MLLHILKRDVLNRKGVNVILFIFITLSTVFLSSSVNNILVVNSAIAYYMEYAKVPDINMIISTEREKAQIQQYLQTKEDVIAFNYDSFLCLSDKAVTIKQNEMHTGLDSKGVSLYLSKIDTTYNKVFDIHGKAFTLNQHEIALSTFLLEQNNLELGDLIHIKMNGVNTTFTIAFEMKDAAFGSNMVGMNRLMISDEDFARFEPKASKIGLFYIDSVHIKELQQSIAAQSFTSIINTATIEQYQLIYSFDMIMAALLIAIGLCLILIAFLVLRFTLVFTMEEQYHEIGIMKAIGIRDWSIKKLYLMKYLLIVSVGASFGLLLSIPVSHFMIQGVSKNMIMADSSANILLNIVCAIMIVILVLLFCYFCTCKLNKVSAITAIRNGEKGERYHRIKGLRLAKRTCMPIPIFLGLNDIVSHIRRYAVLMITFCVSFILITIPLNTLTTMQSSEMADKFMLKENASVFVREIELAEEPNYTSVTQLKAAIERIKQELAEHGYQNIGITAEPIYFIKLNNVQTNVKSTLMTIQVIGDDTSFPTYSAGVAPTLENEIAVSKNVMKQNDWEIGDTIEIEINGKLKEMLITGTYSDYMQLGNSMRLNSKINCDQELMFDYWSIMVDFETTNDQATNAKELQTLLPEYEWITAQSLIDHNIGGIQDTLAIMVFPMTLMLCAVIMLITLLMERLFITREKSEIAIMKSIGFTHRTIQSWQMMRMIFVVIASMMIAVPVSFISNHYVLKPIFAIMGADVAIQIDVFKAYIMYPGILLIGILIATNFASKGIKHIEIRDMNNLE